MAELIRDTAFGHLVRLVTRGKYLQYPEDKDPSMWQTYVSGEKTNRMADQGYLRQLSFDPISSSEASSRTLVGDERRVNEYTAHQIDREKARDTNVVDWFGEYDAENPMNWSIFKKVFVTFEICFLTFAVYIGSAIYSPGIETVMKDFGVSQVKATLGLTLFVAGYGIGPMVSTFPHFLFPEPPLVLLREKFFRSYVCIQPFHPLITFLAGLLRSSHRRYTDSKQLWAPISDIPMIGRNPVYIGTLFVFVLFQLPTALATNFAMLLCFRFLTGFIGSPALATGGASIGDMFAPNKRAYGMGMWGVLAIGGPVLGPLVGGFAAKAKDWRWTIWELMWGSGFCLAVLFFFLPETSSANILYRRSRRLRKLTGIENLKSEAEILGEQMTAKDVSSTPLYVLVRCQTVE
ncbi:MAG: hypothetical protein Q9182_003161 [Xanthomendoza sp. 2 TL-2023]